VSSDGHHAAAAVLEVDEGHVRRQMDMLYHRDRWMALTFIVLLALVQPFIFVAMWSVAPGNGTRAVLIVAGSVLVAYNVASMVKLVRNYHRDRDFIYRRDVIHMAELRAARQARRAAR
jgi:hypothetical protein